MNISPHDWPPGWRPVDHGEGPALERALAEHAGPGQALHGVHAMAIAVSAGKTLYALFGGPAPLAELGADGTLRLYDGWPVWLAANQL